MKHLKVLQKYSAARRIFNSLLSFSPGDETLRLMLDILLEILNWSFARKQPPVIVNGSRWPEVAFSLAWVNSRHFMTPPLVSPQNDDSEKRAQKFYTDDASLSRSGHCCASDFPDGKFTSEALLEGLNGVYRQPSNSLKKKWPENISKFQKWKDKTTSKHNI